MIYKIEIRKKAMKFIEKQDKKQQERLLRAIYKLPNDGDIVKMQGYDILYRLRVEDYRVIFEMSAKTCTITLIDVIGADSRGQVYK